MPRLSPDVLNEEERAQLTCLVEKLLASLTTDRALGYQVCHLCDARAPPTAQRWHET